MTISQAVSAKSIETRRAAAKCSGNRHLKRTLAKDSNEDFGPATPFFNAFFRNGGSPETNGDLAV